MNVVFIGTEGTEGKGEGRWGDKFLHLRLRLAACGLAACGLRLALAACGLRLAAGGLRLAACGLRLAACGLRLRIGGEITFPHCRLRL